jgi:3-deoxy-D-manno-octulosonic-acid transferase
MTLFTFFYLFIALVVYILAIPFLIFLSFKSKYKQSIPARFALFNNPRFKDGGIWFHVASFGEVRSLKPIVKSLETPIHVSTITQTGFEEAGKLTKNNRYLPYELLLPFWITKQKALVVSEAELWYLLFFVAKAKGAKTYLINARISDNSYKSYLRFSWFYKKIFTNIDMVFAQSQKDAKRLYELGAKDVVVNGNIKAFQTIEVTHAYKKPPQEVITLASTHKGEEELILKHLDAKGKKLIVVPRHPERFDEVDRLLQTYVKERRLSYHRFSEKANFDSDVVLVDCMGELINIYSISDVVVLAGSFVDGIGGHNPLEPAHFGCKIVSGKYIFNQEALYGLVEGIEMVEANEILATIKTLKNTKITSSTDIEPIIRELT